MRYMVLAFLIGCGGTLDHGGFCPPAHIVRVAPDCGVISGVLLDFDGLEHVSGPYWFGTFTGELVGSRVEGVTCEQTFELEPCTPGIGWCPAAKGEGKNRWLTSIPR